MMTEVIEINPDCTGIAESKRDTFSDSTDRSYRVVLLRGPDTATKATIEDMPVWLQSHHISVTSPISPTPQDDIQTFADSLLPLLDRLLGQGNYDLSTDWKKIVDVEDEDIIELGRIKIDTHGASREKRSEVRRRCINAITLGQTDNVKRHATILVR